ncbi:MAG: hypothetical protein Q4G08_01900 [Capnocytophaga sp.]|nr:hypothetical protein [Capnocytophaga sp.]
MKKIHYIAIILVLLLFTTDAEAQCAMCRAVLESGEDKGQAQGVNNGIVYLMAFPYLLLGVLGYFIYRKMKKKEA